MSCRCFIIPDDVLRRFGSDPELSDELRQSFHHTAELSRALRAVRDQQAALTLTALSLPMPKPEIKKPTPHQLPPGQVFDCHTGTTLPGAPVANPGTSADATAIVVCATSLLPPTSWIVTVAA